MYQFGVNKCENIAKGEEKRKQTKWENVRSTLGMKMNGEKVFLI